MVAFKYGTDRRRERKIESLRRRLQRKSYPRLHASLILLMTGLAGFLVSFVLLRLGVSSTWLRYPLAILVAYSVFLLLLRVWLSLCRPRDWSLKEVVTETLGVSETTESDDRGFGGGADFAGGGAGGSWGQSVSTVTTTTRNSGSTFTPVNSSGSGGFSFDLDLDDGWVIIPILILLCAALVAALYVVYIAPVLLAEILLDGVLLVGLYERVKTIEHKHWLRSAIRRTALPAALIVVFFTIAGFVMQQVAPEAQSIGEFWKHINDR